jgi:peptidoglycan hydrolase CwlO-like protein
MTKVRALLGVLAVLVLVAFAAGCGLVSDQGQARQEAKKKVEARQEDLKKKVTDLQKKVNELLKKVDALEQQDQKEEK